MQTRPSYKEDILEQLRHHDACSSMIRLIEEMTSSLQQHLARAADEIERLRKENQQLRLVFIGEQQENKVKSLKKNDHMEEIIKGVYYKEMIED